MRVETTCGGGWGDPLEREPELVALNALQGKISARAARAVYGVVPADADSEPRARQPFFDRGRGCRTLAGVDHAELDFVEATTGAARPSV